MDSKSTIKLKTNNINMILTKRKKDNAAPIPQSRILFIWVSINIAIIVCLAPHSSAGVIKYPKANKNTNKNPTQTPLKVCGTKIFTNAEMGLAPKV